MGLVLALILAAIALIVIGVIIDGLFRLLIIGVIVLAIALIFGGVRARRRSRRVRR
jgi:undecaprenyl pyrophosphate phosphatase UppP